MKFKELICEMSTVVRDEFLIAVNPDTKRIGDEYFKVYNASSIDKATKIARIKFRDSSYIIHKNERNFENWILNKKEKNILIKILNTLNTEYDDKGNSYNLTTFQKSIYLFNYEKGLGKSSNEALRLSIEDRKDYLPIDLKMPDYSLL